MKHEAKNAEGGHQLLQDIERMDAAFDEMLFCLIQWGDLIGDGDLKALCVTLDGWREEVHALTPEPQLA
jgi:hypothetical protein